MNRERFLLALLGGSLTLATLACTSRHSDSGNPQPSPANATAIQVTQIVATKPDDTQPANLSNIDLSMLDPNDEHAFDSLFK